MTGYHCGRCGSSHPDDYSVWRCDCGGALWAPRPTAPLRDEIVTGEFSMWRYAAALPLAAPLVQLGEGLTPLVATRWDGRAVRFKDEAHQPSGSFKDRGVSLVVNHALAAGVSAIAEDSSGNAGASFATYAAAAGLPCHIFAPADASSGKLAQVVAHGAHLHRVEGREQCARAAQSGESGVYAGHNWHPLFIEGVTTIAYELWEQSGFRVPRRVVVPVGNGSLVLGLQRGFEALRASGQTGVVPQLYGVQAHAANGLYRRFHGLPAGHAGATVAEGIAIRATTHDDEVVAALRAGGGDCFEVTEDEIVAALRQAVRLGWYIEPTSAAALAGLSRLLAALPGEPDADVVAVLTGNGLKASGTIARLLAG